jgi:hypothetical protein
VLYPANGIFLARKYFKASALYIITPKIFPYYSNFGNWYSIVKAEEKNSRIHLERLQNKYTNYKGIKNNTNFGQITGVQEKLDTICK